MEKAATDMFMRHGIKKALGDMVRVWKYAARERLASLLRYHSIARRTKAEDGTDLGKEPRDPTDRAGVKLWGGSEDDVFCAWRTKAMEDIAYS